MQQSENLTKHEKLIDRTSENKFDSIDVIKEKCIEYIDDTKYVYKKCVYENDQWLVVLEKLEDTMTNEMRDFADKRYAKFRANKLKVIDLININNPSTKANQIFSKFLPVCSTKPNKLIRPTKLGEPVKDGVEMKIEPIRTCYKIREITHSNKYDRNIDNVCSSGIHYFTTIEPAYFYNMSQTNFSENQTGLVYGWYDDGEKRFEADIVKGQLCGNIIFWYEHGGKEIEGKFFNNKKISTWNEFDDNGKIWKQSEYLIDSLLMKQTCWYPHSEIKKYEGEWLNENETGAWTFWHKSGEIFSKGNYLDGKKTGNWISWSQKGKKATETDFLNGKEHGHGIVWNENEKKVFEGIFKNGVLQEWTEWYEDGSIRSQGTYTNQFGKSNSGTLKPKESVPRAKSNTQSDTQFSWARFFLLREK